MKNSTSRRASAYVAVVALAYFSVTMAVGARFADMSAVDSSIQHGMVRTLLSQEAAHMRTLGLTITNIDIHRALHFPLYLTLSSAARQAYPNIFLALCYCTLLQLYWMQYSQPKNATKHIIQGIITRGCKWLLKSFSVK